MGKFFTFIVAFALSAMAQGADIQLVCTPEKNANSRSLQQILFKISGEGRQSDIQIEVIKSDKTALGTTRQRANRSPASLFRGYASERFVTMEGKEVYFIFKPNKLEAGKNSTQKADAGLVWSTQRTYVPFHCEQLKSS